MYVSLKYLYQTEYGLPQFHTTCTVGGQKGHGEGGTGKPAVEKYNKTLLRHRLLLSPTAEVGGVKSPATFIVNICTLC